MVAIQDPQALWEQLQQLDIKITAEGERLKIDAPKGRISDDLRALLTTHKAALLQLSRDRQATTAQVNGYRPIPPVARSARVAASFAQQRMWFLDRLEEGGHAYTIPLFLQATGVLHLAALTQAVNEIIRRHEALRTIFQEPAGTERAPDQVILSACPLPIALVDLTDCAAAERAATIARLTHETATQPFDLATGPLIRLNVVRSHAQEHLLLFALHHIIFDGLSLAIFLGELRSLYAAFVLGQPSPLTDLEIHYADFSVWQQAQLAGRAVAGDLAFWQKHLAGAPLVLELPTDRPRPPIQTFGGARQAFVLSPALTAQLRALGRAQNATLFMTLYAAFASLLARYTGQSDLVIGVPVANRNHPQLEPLIGLFVNTLALRCQVAHELPFADLLQQVKATALQAYRHQDLPFEKLINELNVERSLSYNPLFQVMFAFQDAHTAGFALPGLTVAPFPFAETVAKFDLTMILHEARASLSGYIEYNTDLFDAATIQRLIGHFQVLLQAIADSPATAIAYLPLLTPAEEDQILLEFNATAADYPQDKCFHQLFEAQVARTPRAVAAVFGQEQITYDALNRRSNRWAWQLVEQGLQPGAIVALVAERSIDFLTAILAIWKAGAVYLPCDPTYPSERLMQILQQSRAALVLTERAWLPLFSQTASVPSTPSTCTCLCLEDLEQGAAQAGNLPLRCAPTDLAYVIFTSGSTGIPKGAMVQHQGLLNHLCAKVRDLALTAADRVAQNAPPMFDISIWQFLVTGLVGGTVHILNREIASDPTQLLAALAEQEVTILQVVPSLLRVILEMLEQQTVPAPYFKTVRWLIATGEALPPILARQWLTTYPTIPLLNDYGPAECSDNVTYYPLSTPPAETVINMPIGRPLANMRVYVLDAHRQLLPIGIPGELYIGGVGVGLGYLHDPERTRQAFLPDPFAKVAGARLYKTGDLVRWLPAPKDGGSSQGANLEYLGRVDFQVKIRGFRIELGEIEAVLSQHPAVQAAVLVARSGEAAEKQLVAYVTLALPLDDCTTVLRAWLKARLPEYMLPATVVVLAQLPLSPNGKIDRKALPEPTTTLHKVGYVPPRDSIELRLVQRWEKLLGLAPISVQDNFFELGGDSLLAIRLVSNIQQEFGSKLPLQTLFQSGTVEQLAGLLRQNAAPAPWSPLVCLQAQGDKVPFFCVHAAGGIVFRYLQVAALLGKERPFYGLQSRGIEPGDAFYATIEEMAVDYVAAIRTIQPQGPYLLAGWSFGGTVAFEMARLLEQAGETAPLLIMIDAPSPFVDSYAEDDVEFLLERLRPAAGLVLDKLELQSSRAAQLAYLFNEQRLAGLFAPDIDNAYAQHRLNLHKHHNQIICHYRPAGPVNGRIIFFKPTEAIPFDTRMKEPTVDWARFALGGIEVDDAPGNHFSMFSPTHGPVLAQKIKVCLEKFGRER